MKKAIKEENINTRKVKQRLNEVDKLFADLEKDKALPKFVEHVALCIALGTSDKVNLKTMYPKLHRQLTKFLIKQKVIL